MTPQILFHFTAGLIGLTSGVTALLARKGSTLHRRAGTVFFVAMLTTAGSGAAIGFLKGQPNNGIAGIVTLYLLLTSWVTVRRREGRTGLFEVGAFLFAATAAIAAYYFWWQDVQGGHPFLGGVPFFIISSIIALAALCDLSVLLRRGIAGRQRIARHLWRMLLGFSAAVGSFFPGQLQFFPDYVRHVRPTILLFTPFFAVIATLLIWLVIVLFTKWYDRGAVTQAEAKT